MTNQYPVDYELIITKFEFRQKVLDRKPGIDISRVDSVLDYLSQKFDGITRQSGEPYICHLMRTALALIDFDLVGADEDLLIAALLHDAIEDCGVTKKELAKRFGDRVAEIVDRVTQVSETAQMHNDGTPLTKSEIDNLSDEKFIIDATPESLRIKFADRFDNEMTIWSMPLDKQLNKAFHSRDILIPALKRLGAFRLVDVLQELGFRIDHRNQYERLSKLIENKTEMTNKSAGKTLAFLMKAFSTSNSLIPRNTRRFSRYINSVDVSRRSTISFFRFISNYAWNINDDMENLVMAKSTPLYDINLRFDDEVCGTYLTPKSIVRDYYGPYLEKNGIHIKGSRMTSNGDASYLILCDESNTYRLFCRSESEYKVYCRGRDTLADEDSLFAVDHYDPRSSFRRKIKVFMRNGKAMAIDENSSCLDFAYALHTDMGNHFSYAIINNDSHHYGPYHLLSPGDQVIVVTDEKAHPQLNWFRYCTTAKAKNKLILYFQKRIVSE